MSDTPHPSRAFLPRLNGAPGRPSALGERRLVLEIVRARSKQAAAPSPAVAAQLEQLYWRLVTLRLDVLRLWCEQVLHRHPEARAVLPLEDLLQDATLAALAAARRYDPHRGIRFTTYMKQRVKSDLAMRCGQACRQTRARTSLDAPPPSAAPLDDGGARTLSETIADTHAPDPSANALLRRFFNAADLDGRQRSILTRRLGLDGRSPATLAEMGARWKVSPTRIHQLQAEALDLLREVLDDGDDLADRLISMRLP